MYFEFFKQKYDGKVSNGDEVALFAEHDDFTTSGRYKVAGLAADEDGAVLMTLVGMGPREGEVCTVPINAHED